MLKSFYFLIGYGNDRFFSHNPYILNVTQQCRCSPMLIFRAWATSGRSLKWKIFFSGWPGANIFKWIDEARGLNVEFTTLNLACEQALLFGHVLARLASLTLNLITHWVRLLVIQMNKWSPRFESWNWKLVKKIFECSLNNIRKGP